MTEFKKKHWNLGELEIIEWFKNDERGYLSADVSLCKDKIIEGIEYFYDRYESNEISKDDILRVINECFGDIE